jgi:hypothetical protein
VRIKASAPPRSKLDVRDYCAKFEARAANEYEAHFLAALYST